MTQLTISNQTMSSREIADATGKTHANVMKAIRTMEPAWEKIGQVKFDLTYYIDQWNREQPEYILTKTECLYVATKFNDEARAILVLRWEKLETANRIDFNNPNTVLQLAQNWAEETQKRINAEHMLLQKSEQLTIQERVLEHQAPIVQYANEVLSSKSYHTVTTIGAQFGLSGTTLNRVLVKAKFIRKTEREYSLMADHFGKGYTFTKTSSYLIEETNEWGTKLELRYTEAGRMKIHEIIERAKKAGFLITVRGRLEINKKWVKTESHA